MAHILESIWQVSTNGSLKHSGLSNLSVVLKQSKNGAEVVENLKQLVNEQ
jgi:hypothetical protein